MLKNIQFKKLNKAITSMAIIGVLLVCQLAFPMKAKAETPSYPQQQTDIVWNKLPSTGTAGATIGVAGQTTYYYVATNTSYDASAKTDGTSGLIIKGTVYLFIPSGVTLTCIGAPGNLKNPGGAGIELTEGNSLYITGAGTLIATGGNAGNGGNGEGGGYANSGTKSGSNLSVTSGYGGAGGTGGGGAGAGIGSKGATGEDGGARVPSLSRTLTDRSSIYVNSSQPNNGKNSNPSVNAGSVYKSASVNVTAQGGAKGTGGTAGAAGRGWLDCGTGFAYYYSVGAGGGGGGGGSGYAAADIGKGGASGASGGSGVNGGICGSADVSYCLRNGAGGAGGVGGTDGASATYQTSRTVNVGYKVYTGSPNDAAKNRLSIECWGRDSNGAIGHGTVSGGKSGTAGVAGTSITPTATSYSYSIKFLDRDGAVYEQTDYLFTAKTITVPRHCTSDSAIHLLGWKLVNYGNTLSNSADPFTTAESELYAPGSKIQLSNLTYGNITLQAITEIDYDAAFDPVHDSNFETESLNNIVEDTTGNGIAQMVSGTEPTSNVKVILLNKSDKVDLYKLADISWEYDKTFSAKASWVEEVSTWFSGTEYEHSDIVDNPLLVADMTETLKSKFFGNLLSGDDTVIGDLKDVIPYADASEKGADDVDGTFYTLFKNVRAGMYAVVPEGGYNPVVVSIFPYQNGPGSGWYLDSEYVAKLKHSNVSVNKKINNHDISDTIALNDTVKFDIDLKFPSFVSDYADRVTIKGAGTDSTLAYKLYAVDTMSPAYSLINTTTNKPTITYTLGEAEEGETLEAKTFPATFDYYEFADSSYTGAKTKVTSENYAGYLYNGKDLLDAMGDKELFAVSKSASIYEISEPDVKADGTILTITFNAMALKAFIKRTPIDANKLTITLHYEATVTDKLEIGTEDNTNEIVLNYEQVPETPSEITDTVYGYSYGVQVIKIDGTESTDENTVYLPGAKFKLYKEVEDEPESTADTYIYNDGEEDKYFVAVKDMFTESADSLEEDGVFTSVVGADGIILKGLKEGHYILEEIAAPAGYNTLADDIYFEINKLEDSEAENRYGGRYKIFKEMEIEGEETTYNENGMISLSVLNYKGLMLPSTGGIGTLIFTIIGIVVMLSVVIILVVVRRRKTEDYYM